MNLYLLATNARYNYRYRVFVTSEYNNYCRSKTMLETLYCEQWQPFGGPYMKGVYLELSVGLSQHN